MLTYTADVAEAYPRNSRSCHDCLVNLDVYTADCKIVGEVLGLYKCGVWGKTVQILAGGRGPGGDIEYLFTRYVLIRSILASLTLL